MVGFLFHLNSSKGRKESCYKFLVLLLSEAPLMNRGVQRSLFTAVCVAGTSPGLRQVLPRVASALAGSLRAILRHQGVVFFFF